MIWSPQQDAALHAVRNWLSNHDRKPVFHLFGYAGTGKTTLAIEIAEMVDGVCMFAAFTGKAALVMSRKGCRGARTIHSLIYKTREDPVTGEVKFEKNYDSDLRRASLLIIDECSMVGEEIGTDLLSFRVPILVLGDPAQLPPIEGAGFFTDFSTPEVMLTEIHRQALDNPIITLATTVRTGGKLQPGKYGDRAHVFDSRSRQIPESSLLAADQIICGTNKKRQHLNRQMRMMLRQEGKLPLPGLDINLPDASLPVIGDRIICLKNRHDRSMFNGSLWNITAIKDRSFGAKKKGLPTVSYLRIESVDEKNVHTWCDVRHEYWYGTDKTLQPRDKRGYDEFDYGYAITCHKSQGSQWDKVLIFDEGYVFREDAARWTYTAITRAAEKLIISI